MWWFCLNFYVWGKLLWDPDIDVDALLQEYYQKFYGPAALPMKKFFKRAAEVWAYGDHGKKCLKLSNDFQDKIKGWGELHKISSSGKSPWETLFTPEILNELASYLNEAKKLALETPYKERVEFVEKGFSYTQEASARHCDILALKAKVFMLNQEGDKLSSLESMKSKSLPLELKSNKTGKSLKYPTKVYLSYDKDFIYFLFECKKSDIKPAYAKCQKRDSTVYNDESIELFISPDPAKGYFQICVNPLGCVMDCDLDGSSKWNSDIKVEAKENGNLWRLGVALPFSSLGVKSPPKGTNWQMNIYRNRYIKNKKFERQAWSPTKRGYHCPDKFGTIVFSGKNKI
jgi:hypothetical protein